MNTRATLGLAAAALAVGLVVGLTLGGNGDGELKGGGPGPTKTVAGVPVGYQRSKAGAVRAALAYQSALGDLADPKGPGTRIFDAIASESDRQSIADAMAPGLDVVRKAVGDNGFLRSASVGYELTEYRDDTAEVVIWGVSVIKQVGSVGAQSGWTTTRLRLKWVEGDWKLAAPPDGTDGPTPSLQRSPSDPASITDFVRSLQETDHAPTE